MSNPIYYSKGYKYQLRKPHIEWIPIYPKQLVKTEWIELTSDGELLIRAGYAWDGASGPTIDTKSSMRGSLVHDAIYQLIRLGLIDQTNKSVADDLLHNICVEDGMWHFRAEVWEECVKRLAGGSCMPSGERPILVAP